MKSFKLSLFVIITLFFSYSLMAQSIASNAKSPFVNIVNQVRESVVNIKVEGEEKLRYDNRLPFNDDIFKFFFPPQEESRKFVSMGSGFIFKKEDSKEDKNSSIIFIMTNNHVVNKGKDAKITVTLADLEELKAEVVGFDAETDLAVLKVKVNKKTPIVIAPLGNSDELEIAEWVIAIGNPFGQLGLDRTVTVGVVSALGRSGLYFGNQSPIFQDYIQTDAAINPGNSGGPLLNIDGKVIGVNAAITSNSGGNIGIGFAISINLAKKVADDLINKGHVERAYLGILPQDITAELGKTLNIEKIEGVLVARVEKDSPAEKAGLKNGDVILKFNNQAIANVGKFRIIVANCPIDKKIPVEIVRDKKRKTVNVVLQTRGDNEQAKTTVEQTKSLNLGMKVDELNSEYGRRFNSKAEHGVLIYQVDRNSAAATAGLQPGDVILEINQEQINNIDDYRNELSKIENSEQQIVLLYVLTRNNVYQYITISIE
ncbi:MAG: Do family serine endopeptidase [Candidatus Cloacimonadales bacterium]|jgi:serine protease Do|nr:Do family serine endopeptidase [Candidatus Cloacimonadota bacterium]MDX9977320.1 Do family serine endopeptidase [Candidatus Cloacimonadales bacterium]